MLIVRTDFLDCESVFEQPPDSIDSGDPSIVNVGRAVTHLEQVRLDIMEVGVEHQVQVRLVGHLGHELLLVHHLTDVESLLTQHLPQLLPPTQSLRLIGQADYLQSDSPHLPRNVLRGEGPPGPLSLEELQ